VTVSHCKFVIRTGVWIRIIPLSTPEKERVINTFNIDVTLVACGFADLLGLCIFFYPSFSLYGSSSDIAVGSSRLVPSLSLTCCETSSFQIVLLCVSSGWSSP
jgi:hypothetical protein